MLNVNNRPIIKIISAAIPNLWSSTQRSEAQCALLLLVLLKYISLLCLVYDFCHVTTCE